VIVELTFPGFTYSVNPGAWGPEPMAVLGSYNQVRRFSVMDWLILVGVLALWWGLQVWILPRLGVPT
jgi:hypothetical protein